MSALRAVPDLVRPRVTCLPWCGRGDGHPRERFAEDQTCVGSGGEIRIGTGDDLVEVYPVAKLGQPASVSLEMLAGHRAAHLALNVDQAEQLQAALGAALDLARQHNAAGQQRGNTGLPARGTQTVRTPARPAAAVGQRPTAAAPTRCHRVGDVPPAATTGQRPTAAPDGPGAA